MNLQSTQRLSNNFEEMYTKLFGTEPIGGKKKVENISYPSMKLEKGENLSVFEKEASYTPAYKFIGIAFSTYIIIEIGWRIIYNRSACCS